MFKSVVSYQQLRKPISHVLSPLILTISERFIPTQAGKELVERRDRGRVTFDMLPDDVLFDVFDFYKMDSSQYPWRWHTLAHVCRRWRHIIFESPRRLDLQFICTPRTRVREMLELLPPSLPIWISNSFDLPPPDSTVSFEDGSQVIAALEQRDHVTCISLDDLSSSLLEELAPAMQETFPSLKYVRLLAEDDTDSETDEMAPALPDSFLGESAPSLLTIWLSGISFPEAPKFFLSAGELISIKLDKIPDSGYISPDALATGLSACTMLEMLSIEFLSQYPHPDLANQEVTSPSRISLPFLRGFRFDGNGRYFDTFCQRMTTRVLFLEANVPVPHDVSVDRHVFYDLLSTPPEFTFRYWHCALTDPGLVED